jgi:hypothetical protein
VLFTTVNTETLSLVFLLIDQKVPLPIFDTTMTAITLHFFYGDTTTAHFSSFPET